MASIPANPPGVTLGANQPMFLAWGPDRILLYNDGYATILGRKHPFALGRPFLKVWHEIAADLVPIVESAYGGEAVRMDDITLVMERNGYREETHFSFSYTPVRGEGGQVEGFFCACNEITEQVTKLTSFRGRVLGDQVISCGGLNCPKPSP